MNENFPGPGEIVDAKYLNNAMIDYFHRTNKKLLINTKTEKGIKGGVGTFYGDLVFGGGGNFIKLKDIVSVEIVESSMNEAKEEDKVDTITMDIPLFIRMLEYSREDAAEDMDLHDVTEKAISLGKERGILQMDDYDEIVGTTKEIKEGMGNEVGDKVYFKNEVGEKYPSFKGYYGVIEDTTPASNYNMMATYQVVVYDENDNEIRTIKTDFTNLTSKAVNEAVNLKQAKLSSAEYQKAKKLKDFKSSDWKWNADEDLYTKVTEATDYMKRRKAEDDYATKKPKQPAYTGKTDYMKRREKGLEEKIDEALNSINEELCPAGKAYIKRRQAAGEKSSAYLSGRGVKVCKGQMSGKAKKK
jgi:hypothetical protein